LHSKIHHLIQKDHPYILQIQKIQTAMLGSIESQVNELRRLQNYFEENQADKQQASNQKND
ncbi:MAG: cyclic nucleotide-binding protein, partial [Liquorilactobacillus satsumensis]